VQPGPHGLWSIQFDATGPRGLTKGTPIYMVPGTTHVVDVITDAASHVLQVTLDGAAFTAGVLTTAGPAVVNAYPARAGVPFAVSDITPRLGQAAPLCVRTLGALDPSPAR
jgi:hypothetical protein